MTYREVELEGKIESPRQLKGHCVELTAFNKVAYMKSKNLSKNNELTSENPTDFRDKFL